MPAEAGIAYRYSKGGDSIPGSPPLVYIHGAGGSSLHWPPQLRRLPGLEIYALDLPGHGASAGTSANTIVQKVGQVLAWKSALGLGPCVFAGHSMGGAIVQTLALDHPAQVAGLILVGTGGRLRVHPDILSMTSSTDQYPGAVETILTWAFSKSADRQLVALAGKRMLQVPAQVVHADYLACDTFDVLPRLGDIDCPTLVICGSEDQLTPPKYSQFLVEQIADASLVLIPNAGHMVML
ncbi:MAG: alpha/beta hydrolase, partial [Anaerolineales bacterium]